MRQNSVEVVEDEVKWMVEFPRTCENDCNGRKTKHKKGIGYVDGKETTFVICLSCSEITRVGK